MPTRRVVIGLLALLLISGIAGADTKIIKRSHTDPVTIMGQTQPAQDETSTTWFADDRMRVDQGTSTVLVRMDQKKLYLVDHSEKTYTTIELPLDMAKLMPPEMAGPMMEMMKFKATVTPRNEKRTVAGFETTGYDLVLESQMMQMKSTVWVTKAVEFNLVGARAMAEEMMRLQPGMADIVAELRKLDGYTIAQENVATMMGSQIKSSETVESIEESSAPEGGYDPPAGYKAKKFDFMEMMQRG